MVKCPECSKELKHQGALNGHLAFSHGLVTRRALTLSELRKEVKRLRADCDALLNCLKPVIVKGQNGKEFHCLMAYDKDRRTTMSLLESSDESWYIKNGDIWIVAEVTED